MRHASDLGDGLRPRIVCCLLAIQVLSGCGPAGDLINYVVRSFLYEPFRIPAESMAPTLLVGDHLFVSKSEYDSRSPRAGEVAVFWVSRSGYEIRPADLAPSAPKEAFIKRVVGLPGDTVEVRGGRLYLNDELVPESSTGERYTSKSGQSLEIFQTRVGEFQFEIVRGGPRRAPDLPRTVVPPDRYFVMGDNRDNSNDSRFWGTVVASDFVGPATYIYLSSDDRGGGAMWRQVQGARPDARRITSR